MTGPDCWAPDEDGELRTTHPHFEGRCVVEPMDDDFRERVDAMLSGGWPEWERVRKAQRGQCARVSAPVPGCKLQGPHTCMTDRRLPHGVHTCPCGTLWREDIDG